MSDDELKVVALAAFKSLINSNKLSLPATSLTLLTKVMTVKLPLGLLPNATSTPRFKLTDLRKFESIIEDLSATWTDGLISYSRDTNGSNRMMIWELALRGSSSAGRALANLGFNASQDTSGSKKRKRVVDEDADSAAGDQEEFEEEESNSGAPATLSSLSQEMREVYTILQKSTAKGRLLAERFQSIDESFEPICSHVTKEDCARARTAAAAAVNGPSSQPSAPICDRIHFRPLIRPHTDITLGHCSYLNTCYSEPTYAQSPSIPPFPGTAHSHGMAPPNSRVPSMLPSGLGAGGRGKEKAPCRYLHYEVDWDGTEGEWKRNKPAKKNIHRLKIGMGPDGEERKMLPPQWINCDLRHFDYSVLGKFHVIMADPPWDIHMSLPYGTMKDDEMRAMPIPTLQDEGFLFLWVTGRAMEVGRECLKVWGYTRVDEVAWVKTNQLQRVIRTGRTGHWLNHTKEHMLVGVKTITDDKGALKFPSWANRGLDTDVIVSEVRETSRKPEEVYGLIERLCPGGRKVEIFGRKHNTRPG
ncbi:MT-A70-domain-containing protein [Panaeolus papilionaceus]|nr:MT-A70-domain-containing protein [Panaeolus papilionaceus]